MKLYGIILIGITVLSCNQLKKSQDGPEKPMEVPIVKKGDQIIWVNSYTAQCNGSGIAPMSCLLIQEEENWQEDKWKISQTKIIGFDYVPGYRYKLVVRKSKINPEENVTNGSTINMELVAELSKERDANYFLIHDIWALTQMDGETIAITTTRPSIEINASELRVLGNGTCNALNGRIDHLTPSEIKFGPIISTRKFCPDQEIETNFLMKLNQVSHYQIKNMNLIFTDAKGNELLRFKKVD
jgi:heat shock protein HslJ